MFLDLIPQRTLKDLFAVFGGLDSDVLESMLTRHTSGLALLSSPMNSFESPKILKANVEKMYELLCQEYEVVVVDTDQPNAEITQLAFKLSDLVVVMTGADLPRLKSTKFFISDLTGKVSADKIKIVLNRYSAAKEISNAEAQSIIEFPIAAYLPHDGSQVASSINQGKPLILTHANKPISEAIAQFAAQLYAPSSQTAVPVGGRSGFRKLFN